MDSVVVSARVDRAVIERLEKEGFNVSEEFREFLKRRADLLQLKKTIRELSKIIDKNVKPSEAGFSVRSVREDRNAAH